MYMNEMCWISHESFFINYNYNKNNNNYAADIPRGGSSCPLSPGCGFVEGEKSEDSGKKTLGTTTRTTNKLHPRGTAGPGIKPHP